VSLIGGEEGSVDLMDELCAHVAERIGKIARLASIVFTPELPKTRSGKIMRRLLRDVAEHRSLGDTSTLADPPSSRRSRRGRNPSAASRCRTVG
jgi:acetyl-CoA synthetase